MIEIAFQVATAIALLGLAVAAVRASWRLASAEDARRETAALIAIEQAHAQAEAARAAAAAALQPRSVHYAPHIITRAVATSDQAQVSGSTPLPDMTDFASLGFHPTPQAVLLALGAGGVPITVPARNLMHTGLIGASGGGKSNTGRLILAQLLACGVECIVADPHFAEYDGESGEDWRPIAQRLKMSPARKAGEIGDLFGWLGDELQRRLELRSRGERLSPIVAYLDELPSIVNDVTGATEMLSRLLREGRKVALYVMSASQDMLVRTLKTGGEIRENLRSCYYSGGSPHSASLLLDMTKREINPYEQRLGQGVVLLRSAATPKAILARVPYASNGSIRALLGSDTGNEIEVGGKPGDTPSERRRLSIQEQRILALARAATPISQIVQEVWGVRGGGKYQERAAEVMRVIAGHLR